MLSLFRCRFHSPVTRLIVAWLIALSIQVRISESITVDICSDGETYVADGRVNISSPGYPASEEIVDSGVRCSCYLRTEPNSRDQLQVSPIAISYNACSSLRCDTSCWSSLSFWFSSQTENRKFCLSEPTNFTTDFTVRSTFLSNISYAANKRYSAFTYSGKFIFSISARRAQSLRISCHSGSTTNKSPRTTVSSTTLTTRRKSRTTRTSKTTLLTTRSSTAISNSASTTNRILSSSTARTSTTASTVSSSLNSWSTSASSTTAVRKTVGDTTSMATDKSTTVNDITTSMVTDISTTASDTTTSMVTDKSTTLGDTTIDIATDKSTTASDTTTSMATDKSTTVTASDTPTGNATNEFTTDTRTSMAPIRSTSDTDISSSFTETTSANTNGTFIKISTGASTATVVSHGVDGTTFYSTSEYLKPSEITWQDDSTTAETNNTTIPIPDRKSNLIVIAVLLIFVLILIIAIVIIILCVRKSRKSSGKVSFVRNSRGTLCMLTMNEVENESLSTDPEIVTSSGNRIPPSKKLPPLKSSTKDAAANYEKPRRSYNRQSSNYTPMGSNSPSRVNKTSISANIYADLDQIANQRGSEHGTPNPIITITDADRVYYNSAPENRPRSSSQQSGNNAYETCYSPDGSVRLGVSNSNTNDYDYYAPIREREGSLDSSKLESPYSVINDDRFYSNISNGQRDEADNETQKNELTLVENPFYASKK